MRASFVIPLYNCLPLTQAMLASLRATLPPALAHEIILVDDGSTDGTRDWLTTLAPPCRVLQNARNSGFAATCNRGAATATGEVLFFLNNDLVLLPGWLEPMLAAFARHLRTGIVGNVQLVHATGAVDHAGVCFDHKGKPAHLTRRGLAPFPRVDAATGACLAVRADLWRQLGGFDEGYVNGGEDIDLCLRARTAGYTCRVARRSVVRHHVSASLGRKLRDEHNTRRLFRRWREFIAARITRRCARDCLLASWDEPRNYPDAALAGQAFLHWLGLLPVATRRLRGAARTRLDCEELRWTHVLDGAPARDERTVGWQFYPLEPEAPPVL